QVAGIRNSLNRSSGDIHPVESTVSNAYAIEVRAGVRGGGVRVTGRAGLADDVALDGEECRLRRQIGAALEIICDTTHAFPSHNQPRRIIGFNRRQHFQHRQGVGRIQAGDPILVNVHSGAVQVGVIRRAVGGQAILLQSGIGNDGSRCLIFVSADVHRAADNVRIAVQVGAADDIGVVAGVDARGVGLQATTPMSVVYELWVTGDVADTAGGHGR